MGKHGSIKMAIDNYTIDTKNAQGWANFQAHCYDFYRTSSLVNIIAVYDTVLAEQFGMEYPRVRVKTPRTYPAYLRFRTEQEYLAFALKWA